MKRQSSRSRNSNASCRPSNERQSEEIERLTLERDFYSKRGAALEEKNRELTDAATKYSLHAQKLERELTESATKNSVQAQKLQRELTEMATRYFPLGPEA